MLTVIAAALALASSAGSPGQEGPDDYSGQWSCSLSIYGSKESSVMVSRHQTGRGTVLSRSLGWRPPVLDRFAPRDPRPEAPTVSIFYDLTEQGDIGPSDMVLGSGVSVGGPATILVGARLSLSIDGEGAWTLSLPPEGPGPDYAIGPDLVRYRSAFFRDPDLLVHLERGGAATLSLIGADGYLAGQTEYDLSYTGERDHLFVEARDKVDAMMQLPVEEALARYPYQCARASRSPPPEIFVPLQHDYEPLPPEAAQAMPSDPAA